MSAKPSLGIVGKWEKIWLIREKYKGQCDRLHLSISIGL